MNSDFYCDEVLSGRTEVAKVMETDMVLAYQHTRPFYENHIVVIPKIHIESLISNEKENTDILLLALMSVIKKVASEMVSKTGAATVFTNIGNYQDEKHFHLHVVSGEKIR